MVTFDQFGNKHRGSRVDYDHRFGFQCVDLIRQGLYEIHGIAGGGGVPRAIDYWLNTPQELLDKGFQKIGSSDVQKGDIVILWGLPGNDVGHIGWGTGVQTGSQIEILEQNGQTGNGSGEGGDAIRTRLVDKSRVAGLLRPPATVLPSFRIVTTYSPARELVVIRDTARYNLNLRTIPEMAAAAIGPAYTSDRIAAVALAEHINGEYYFVAADSADTGWNTKDCTDYTPPPPPYVPPAPPLRPTIAETVQIVTKVMYFSSDRDAKDKQNYQGDLLPGKYYVYAKEGKAWNLSDSNVHDRKQWVNMDDNVTAPPVVVVPTVPTDVPEPAYEPVDPPAPILPKYQFQMITPVQLEAINAEPQTFPDLEGKTKILAQLNPGKVNEYSMRTIINGEEWLVPTVSMKRGYRHAIPRDLLDFPQMEGAYSPFDTDQDGRVEVSDFLEMVPKWYKTTVAPTIQKITTNPKINEVTIRAKKTIDGFSKRTKK